MDPDRLTAARLRCGLTIAEVGEQAKVSRSAAYRAFEGGRCGVQVARAIAHVLRTSLADLWAIPTQATSDQLQRSEAAEATKPAEAVAV